MSHILNTNISNAECHMIKLIKLMALLLAERLRVIISQQQEAMEEASSAEEEKKVEESLTSVRSGRCGK